VPEPKITRPTDVLIRIKMVGVCGSDIHYYNTGRIGSQIIQFQFTVGHEAAGIVEQVGSSARGAFPFMGMHCDRMVQAVLTRLARLAQSTPVH